MSFRDGTLSTFPSSIDQFELKTPFGGANDLEDSDHFNHYFDAAFNLEAYLVNISGGSIVTYTSKSSSGLEISGSSVVLSTETLSTNLSTSGTTFTISSSVPSIFGSNPFYDPRFSLVPTVHLNSTVSGDLIKGVTANNPDNSTYLNALMGLPQVYSLIKPTGGRDFDCILKVLPSPFSGTDFGGVFYENFSVSYGSTLGPNWDVKQTSGSSAWDIYSPNSSDKVLRLWHKRSGSSSLGSTLIRAAETVIPSTTLDQETDFELEKRSGSSGFYRARVGPMVRCTGTTASANFYGVALSNTDTGYYTAQLVKLTGADLTKADSPNEPLDEDWGIGNGIQTNLGSSFTITTTARTSGNQTVRYRLRAIGTTISFEEKIGSGSWTSLVSVTDSSLVNGSPGFFTKRCAYGGSSNYVNFWIDDVYLRSLDSSAGTGYTATIRLVFALIGSQSYEDIGVFS